MSNIKNKFLDTYRKIKRIFFRKYAFDAIPYSIADMKKFKKHPTTLICEGVLVRNFSADVEIGENSQIGPYYWKKCIDCPSCCNFWGES